VKAVMWLEVKQNVRFLIQGCIGFIYNLPRSFKCCNPDLFQCAGRRCEEGKRQTFV